MEGKVKKLQLKVITDGYSSSTRIVDQFGNELDDVVSIQIGLVTGSLPSVFVTLQGIEIDWKSERFADPVLSEFKVDEEQLQKPIWKEVTQEVHRNTLEDEVLCCTGCLGCDNIPVEEVTPPAKEEVQEKPEAALLGWDDIGLTSAHILFSLQQVMNAMQTEADPTRQKALKENFDFLMNKLKQLPEYKQLSDGKEF